MATQCLHSDDFDPSQFTIIGGPYSTPDGCVDNFCVCSGVDCGSSGIDPITCNCVPSGVYDPPNDRPDLPKLDCSGIDEGASLTINGYAYYFDNPSTVTLLGETLNSPCNGGHWCNRAEFTPTLEFANGTTLNANKNINLDNGSTGGDVSDTFSFTYTGQSSVLTSGVNLKLLCAEANNNCHFDITWIILTMTDAATGSGKILFSDCVVPGTVEPLTLECVGALCSDLSNSSDSYNDNLSSASYTTTLLTSIPSQIYWNSGYPSTLGTLNTDYVIYKIDEYISTIYSGHIEYRARSNVWVLACSGGIVDVTSQAVASGAPVYYPGFVCSGTPLTVNIGDYISNSVCEYSDCTSDPIVISSDCSLVSSFYFNKTLPPI